MKYIIFAILTLIASVLGIILILEFTDKQYQSVIAIAVSTASIQLILFFLKLEFERNSHKNTKSYGVVYDKKFIIYNDLLAQIVDARSFFVHFTKVKDLNEQRELFDKIEDIKKTILKNRIIISNYTFLNINSLYALMRSNYDKYIKVLLHDKSIETSTGLDVENYIKSQKLSNEINDLLDLMKKELNAF